MSSQSEFPRIIERLERNDPTLTELYLRGKGIGAKGAAALAEALRTNTSVTALDLSYNQFGEKGAAKLADALRTNTSVTALHLGGNQIGDEGAATLAEALRTNTSVTTLWLDGNQIGNEGAAALAEALRTNTSVTELRLYGNHIGDEGGAALADALRTNTSVTELILAMNQIGNELQSMIDRMVDINKVASNPQEASNQKAAEFGPSPSEQRVKEEAERSRLAAEAEAQRRQEEEQRLRRAEEESSQSEFSRIIERLERNDPTLTELDLRGKGIGAKEAAKLADALRTNTSVTELNLYDNEIGAKGAAALGEALRTNTSVTALYLDGNRIGDEGAAALADALRTNTSVTELGLGDNRIGDEGAAALAEALRTNTSVTELGLGSNRIGDEGAAALAEALRTNTNITALNLYDNKIGDEGAAALADALRANTSITTLDLSYNQFGDEGAATIQTELRRIRNQILEDEIIAAAKQGCCPWRQGRVNIVGRGRAGKTSLLASLRGEEHDASCKSTAGIELSDFHVRDLGVDIKQFTVHDQERGRPWKAAAKRGNVRQGAIRAEAGRSLREGRTSYPAGSGNAMQDLLRKYGFGREVTDVDDELFKQEEEHVAPESTSRTNRKRDDDTDDGLSNGQEVTEKEVEQKPHGAFTDHTSKHVASSVGHEVAVRHDIEADDGTGDTMRISVWDYGGQVVFRNIQHLYMPRNCCYVVVFRAKDILDDNTRSDALADIRFWLKSIDTHATCHDAQLTGLESQELIRALRYAPVLLVATHIDLIKESMPFVATLHRINAILLSELPDIESFQASKEASIDGREFLYNDNQDLCFWPVDNTDSNDKNVRKLRSFIVQAIQEDRAEYLKDRIPLSWLDMADRLSAIAEDEPLLRLYAEDPEMPSVVGLMRQAGALNDLEGSKPEKLAAEKRRAVALLQFLHQIGVVVYFENVPSLQHYCILDPQWLLDTIAYVIRDFKLHRFRRDRNAMDVDDGAAWNLFLRKGILKEKLLDYLWLGEDEHRNFLLRLMMKINIFALLPKSSEDGGNRFFVPSIVSLVGETPFELPDLSTHLAIAANHEAFCAKFDFKTFLPTGVFERVVARLVGDYWPRDVTASYPVMLPNVSQLLMGSGKHAITLAVNCDSNTIEVFVSSNEEASLVLPHVELVIRTINEEMYRNCLDISHPDFPSGERQLRTHHAGNNLGSLANRLTSLQLQASPQVSELIAFFLSAKINESNARKYSELMLGVDSEIDRDVLKGMFDACDGDTKAFRDEMLKDEYGISKMPDQLKIVDALKKCPAPREEKPYLLGFFDAKNLDCAEKEREVIRISLSRLKLKMTDYDMGPLSAVFDATRSNKNKVLHLAMHGEAISAKGESTLAFSKDDQDDAFAEPESIAETIALGCARDDGKPDGSIECVFINACKGNKLAKLLKDHAVPFVICWKTAVRDEAAQAFAEEFYRSLSENESSFANAYRRAITSLEQRDWVVDEKGGDPGAPKEALLQRQREENNLKLEAAGIPSIYEASDGYQSFGRSDPIEILGERIEAEGVKNRQHITEEHLKTRSELKAEGKETREAVTEKVTKAMRAIVSIESAKVPTLWVLTKKHPDRIVTWGIQDTFELRMLCQLTGECPHEPILLKFPSKDAQKILRRTMPLVKATWLLLKIGTIAGKAYGIPLPTTIPFLDDILDGDKAKVRNIGTLEDSINGMIENCERLEGVANTPVGGSLDAMISRLDEWRELSTKCGLETCEQLRVLMKEGGKKNMIDTDKIVAISKLHKVIGKDGSCIWVTNTREAKDQAMNLGYLEPELQNKSGSEQSATLERTCSF